MSFDVSVESPDGDECCSACEVGNYTYNCNPMLADALNQVTDGFANAGNGSIAEIMGFDGQDHRASGLFVFQDAPCVESAGLLREAIDYMVANPARYEAMNPKNGWGDYRTWVDYLESLYAACVEHPTWRIYIS